MIKKIAFTVYAITDMKKSRDFYENVLELKPSDAFKDSENWVEYALGEDSTFSIGCSPEWKPSEDGACVAFEVENFVEFTTVLKEKGVTFKMDPMEFGTCHMAVVKDPDLNNIIIHQIK